MELNWNGWSLLFLLISGQGLLLAGLVYKSKPTYKYFAASIFAFSILLIYYLCFWTDLISFLPRWLSVLMGIPYLMAALLYRQVRNVTLWHHLIIFVLFISFVLGAQLIQVDQRIYTYQAAFQCMYLLIYSNMIIRASGTNTDRLLGWLFLGYSLAHLSYYLLSWMQLITPIRDYFVSLAGAIFMYAGAYFILFGKRKKIGTDDLQGKMRNILIERIEEEKLYLDSSLRLGSLSKATGFSTHQISELINSGGKNFADLINGYRVKEAQRMLESLDYERMSTTEIGYESGFNNKSTFYKHFKAATGESPMQYRNRRKIAHTAEKE